MLATACAAEEATTVKSSLRYRATGLAGLEPTGRSDAVKKFVRSQTKAGSTVAGRIKSFTTKAGVKVERIKAGRGGPALKGDVASVALKV